MALPHARKTWRRQKHQKYKILPWIVDPTSGVKKESDDDHHHLVFHQREEAHPMELFFDLFFVANLALFTQYHIIIEHEGFLGYVEFFGILWGAWFSITLFDVRFALDSIYERACKVVQCSVLVALALVGSDFVPGTRTLNPENPDRTDLLRNFRILSYALAASRALLTIQYAITTMYCARRKLFNLILPLGLNTGVYAISSIAFGLVSLAFHDDSTYYPNIYIVWYVTMAVEVMSVLLVSGIWRQLSFKLTHLVERLGLLTLIIIGEGIIGITKTISIILKTSSSVEYYGLVFSILLIIFWLYMCYFDTQPKGHFGTVRQQLWAFLHFPLHLSMVGILEGAQQAVRERYVINGIIKWATAVTDYCLTYHQSGSTLQDSFYKTIETYKFQDKSISNQFFSYIEEELYDVGNDTDICTPANVATYGWKANDPYTWDQAALPGDLRNLTEYVYAAAYSSSLTDQQVPVDELQTYSGPDMWAASYYYFWGALALFCFTTIIMGILSRKSKFDLFSLLNIASRTVVMVIGIVLGTVGATDTEFYNTFSAGVAMVPVMMGLLLFICMADRTGKWLANWRLRNVEDIDAILYEEAEKEEGSSD